MGVGAVNPHNPQIHIQHLPNQQQQQVQEQLESLIKSGFFAKKGKVPTKLPASPVATAQVAANQVIAAVMPTLIKSIKKVTDKTTEEIFEDAEKLEEAMDKVEETLEEIINLKDDPGGKKNPRQMSKQEHIERFFESMEEHYEALVAKGIDEETIALFVTIFYERISKSAYNSNGNYVLALCFRLPSGIAPSPFRSELMFNYLLDLTLKFPDKIYADFHKPLTALTDLLMTRPRGIPGLYTNLKAIQDPHRNDLLKIWATMICIFPYTIAFPKVFGEEGCNAIAEWCHDLYLQKTAPDSADIQMIETFTKGLGTPFKNALVNLNRKIL